jgi:hypothetical protein
MLNLREQLDLLNFMEVVGAELLQMRSLKMSPDFLWWPIYVPVSQKLPGELGALNGVRYIDLAYLRRRN